MCFTDRQYGSSDEEDYRKQLFMDNIKKFEAHNKDYINGKTTYVMDINQFTDMWCSSLSWMESTEGSEAGAILIMHDDGDEDDGVFKDDRCKNGALDHCLLIVGYGTSNGDAYWIAKNRGCQLSAGDEPSIPKKRRGDRKRPKKRRGDRGHRGQWGEGNNKQV
nr:hypothetical protein BaRGS_016920 [Batillaria attramentaria]